MVGRCPTSDTWDAGWGNKQIIMYKMYIYVYIYMHIMYNRLWLYTSVWGFNNAKLLYKFKLVLCEKAVICFSKRGRKLGLRNGCYLFLMYFLLYQCKTCEASVLRSACNILLEGNCNTPFLWEIDSNIASRYSNILSHRSIANSYIFSVFAMLQYLITLCNIVVLQ